MSFWMMVCIDAELGDLATVDGQLNTVQILRKDGSHATGEWDEVSMRRDPEAPPVEGEEG